MPVRIDLDYQARVQLLLSGKTQKQLARELGVSDRTIRRWKNEGVKPSFPRREVLRAKSDARVRVLSRGKRRRLKEYDSTGKATGRKYDSPWRNYDVRHLTTDEIAELISSKVKRAQRSGKNKLLIQLFIDHPNEHGTGIKRTGLMIFDVMDYELDEILEEVEAAEGAYDAAQVSMVGILA